jgi:hypothetical protein
MEDGVTEALADWPAHKRGHACRSAYLPAGDAADDAHPTTETPTQMIGAWELTVTFADGPLQGQAETSRLFFAPDHTCLILLPYLGAGT